MPARSSTPTLGTRALNRALLARQFLLKRKKLTPVQVIEHLVGMQAQVPNPPYIGLWTRLQRFQPDDLSMLVRDRKVVRIALMRSTIHLVSANDCMLLRRLLQPVLQPSVRSAFGRGEIGVEAQRLSDAARALVEERPRTWAELGALLAPRWPDVDPQDLSRAVRALLPLVQVPPRGLWGTSGQAVHTTAEHWLGAAPPIGSVETIVRRYLAAFGPATVNDAQAWSGLTRLRDVLDRMRPELRMFRDVAGRELFDLADAPRPGPDTPAPIRFLPEYDNLLLSHADRSRIMPPEHKARVFSANGIVSSTVLVDGFVRATWKITSSRGRALLTITPLSPVAKAQRPAIAEEGERLLGFAAADATSCDVRWTN